MNKKSANLTISKLIKEEARKIISEQAKIPFDKWALHILQRDFGDSIPSTITAHNVVNFLQGSKFKLSDEEFQARKSIPASYVGLLNQYKNRDTGESIADEPVANEAEPESDEDKLTYASGDVPLNVIGQEMGMTKMGAKKKIDAATEKLNRLAADDDRDNGVANMLSGIDKARVDGAKDYLLLLAASKGNVNSFLKALESSKLCNIENDIGRVSNNEKQAIKELFTSMKTHGIDVATEMLISDLEEDPAQRIWQTYQAVVARKASPRKKKAQAED